MLKSLLRSTAYGVAFAIGVVGVMSFAGTPTGVPRLDNYNTSATQGPGATLSGNFPADYADINTMMSLLNSTLANYLSFNQTGEVGAGYFSNPASFTANGSTATSVTSVGPSGAHTTVQKWLTIYDNTGAVGYIPVF